MPEFDEAELHDDVTVELAENVRIETEAALGSFTDVTPLSNSIDYLARSVNFLLEAEGNPSTLKWVAISLHGALYGFCVVALNSCNIELVRQKNGKLKSFGEVLKLCQEFDRLKVGNSLVVKPLELSERQDKAVEIIHKRFRNIFEHPNFSLLSFANIDIAQNAFYMFEIIEQLTLNTGAFQSRFSGQEKAKVAALCVAGKELSRILTLELEQKLKQFHEADTT